MNTTEIIGTYVDLITQFASTQIDANEFDTRFTDKFSNETEMFPEVVFQTLDELFGWVDAYCADPTLRDANDIDEEQLRRRASQALAKLSSMGHRSVSAQ